VFRTYIDNNENDSSLVENGSEAEFLNESFAHEKSIETFELNKKDRVELILGDGTASQIIDKRVYIDLTINEHRERLFCYVAKLECVLILRDEWLQTHNPVIN
jgi:hypothetical protein